MTYEYGSTAYLQKAAFDDDIRREVSWTCSPCMLLSVVVGVLIGTIAGGGRALARALTGTIVIRLLGFCCATTTGRVGVGNVVVVVGVSVGDLGARR